MTLETYPLKIRIPPFPFSRRYQIYQQLANQLGVDCKVIDQLAKAGYLKVKTRRATDSYRTIKFAPDAAEKLLKTVVDLPILSNTSIPLASLKQEGQTIWLTDIK